MRASTLEAKTDATNGGRLSGLIRRATAHPVLTVFLVALLVRVAGSLAVWFLWGGFIFGDELTYSKMASDVVEGRTHAWDDYTWTLYWYTAAWSLPLTALYALVGPHIIAGQLLAALAGAGAAALTARLALEALEPRWALGAGLVVALFPSQVLWSTLTLKDAAVWLVAVAVGIAVARAGVVSGRRLAAAIGLLVVGLVAMAFLRTHSFVVLTWATALGLMVTPRPSKRVRFGVSTAILIVVPLLLGVGPAGLTFAMDQTGTLAYRRFANAQGASTAIGDLGARTEGQQTATSAGEVAGDAARYGAESSNGSSSSGDVDAAEGGVHGDDSGSLIGGASSGEGLQQDTPGGGSAGQPAADPEQLGGTSLEHLPYGLSAMLVEPIPGVTTGDNPRLWMAAVENVLWYPLLLLAAVGLASVWGHRRVLAYPVLMAGAITLVYSLTEGNFGTAYRHRGEIVWVVVLLATFGARRLWRRYRQPTRTAT